MRFSEWAKQNEEKNKNASTVTAGTSAGTGTRRFSEWAESDAGKQAHAKLEWERKAREKQQRQQEREREAELQRRREIVRSATDKAISVLASGHEKRAEEAKSASALMVVDPLSLYTNIPSDTFAQKASSKLGVSTPAGIGMGSALAEMREIGAKVKAEEEQKAAERNEGLMGYDLQTGKADIDKLSADVSRAVELSKDISSWGEWIESYENPKTLIPQNKNEAHYNQLKASLPTAQSELDAILSQYGAKDVSELQERLTGDRLYYREAEEAQKMHGLTSAALEAEDFETYSAYKKTDGYKLFSDEDKYYEYFNDRENARARFDVLDYVAASSGAGRADLGLDYISDEETAIYNYYHNKYGAEKSWEYLEAIIPTLKARAAQALALKTNNTWREPFLNFGAGVERGAVNATTGVYNAITGKYEPISYSPTVQASQIMMSDDKGVGKLVNEVSSSIGNMLPSVLVGFVNPVAGAATMGVSSAGGAYDQMIRLGYDKNQARTYAGLIGASEAVFSSALSGISKLGGKLTGAARTKFASAVDNALAKVAINRPVLASGIKTAGKIGINMAGEATEEALQTVLEPLFKSWATSEAYLAADFEDVAYSALVGALTGFAMEGPSTIVSDTSQLIKDSGAAKAQKAATDAAKAERHAAITDFSKKYGDQSQMLTELYGLGGGDQSKAFVELYELGGGNQDVNAYAREFDLAYSYGEEGISADYYNSAEVQSQFKTLTPHQRDIAAALGRDAALERSQTGEAAPSTERAGAAEAVPNTSEQERIGANAGEYTEATAKSQTDANLEADADLLSDADISADVADMVEADKASDTKPTESGMTGMRVKSALESGALPTAEQEARVRKAARAKTDTARTGYLSGAKEEDIRTAEYLSKVFGRKIVFNSDEYTANGKFADDTVFVNPEGDDVFETVVMHELAHSAEGTKAYDGLLTALKEYSAERYGENHWDELVVDNQAKYAESYKAKTGKEYTDAKAELDVAARMLSSFFGNDGRALADVEADVMKFAKTNRTAASRMWYTLKRAAVRIKENIADARARGKEGYNAEARERQLMLRKVEKMRDMLAKALRQAKAGKTSGEGGFSFRQTTNEPQTSKQFNRASVEAALWESFDHSDEGHDNLIKVGQMPQYIVDKFGIDGDIYIYRNHAYENMVSREDAIAAGRPTRRGGKDIHFHNLGIEKMTDALMSINDPTMVMDDTQPDGHPEIIMLLSEFGNNGAPLYTAISFYDRQHINGRITHKPHLVLTIAERNYTEKDGRRGYDEIIKEAVENGKVLDYNKKRGDDLSEIAQHTRLGNITKSSLDNSIAQFKKKVKAFREKYNISYSFAEGNDGTRAINEREEKLRLKAIGMLEKGIDGETVYEETGWYQNDYGNLVVDHEAPVYLENESVPEKIKRFAEHVETKSDAVRSENAVLREEAAAYKRRAEAAEKAAKRAERDIETRIALDRQLSPEYVPSKKQVSGIVDEICTMLGGGFKKADVKTYKDRLLAIYDRMIYDRGDITRFSREIVDLITEMQDARVVDEDMVGFASQMKAALKVPMYLSEKARGDFSEGFSNMRKRNSGRINLVTKENGTPVDVRYMELSEQHPDWFPEDITNEADQLKRIIDVANTIYSKEFTSKGRYSDIGADPEAVRESDLSKVMIRIVDGFNELETVPRTFADGVMRQLEFERREHQRELARETDSVREELEERHAAEMEALMQEAEDAMEWETRYLRDRISEMESKQRAQLEKEAADKAAADRRAHARGRDMRNAAIEASQKDGSFTKKANELYERLKMIEDELERVEAECKKHEGVNVRTLRDSAEAAYIKALRARRDTLIEDKSNLNAYIDKMNARVKEIRFKVMCDMIAEDGYFKGWDDKKPLSYMINTMRRNINDIKPKNRDSAFADYMIKEILDPITTATYMSTVVQNEIRARVKALGLSTKARKGDTLSESQFVQAYAEAQDNIKALDSGAGSYLYNKRGERMREGMTADEWRGYLNRIVEENPSISKDAKVMEKIERSVEEFKAIYDELFTLVNNARVRNGYAPVPYRRGYFPHYNNGTKQDGALVKLLEGLGFAQEEISDKLPTSINGLTATFKPGIRYMSNAKQRSLAGFEFEQIVTGAVEGLDRYIEVATDVAFQTDNIQNLRTLTSAIRYMTTPEEARARIAEIRKDKSKSTEEKQEKINAILTTRDKGTKYKLNSFVLDLEEYTNLLAGKKSKHDRWAEDIFGRKLYSAMKKLSGRVSSNLVLANISSILTNYIPTFEGGAVMQYHMLGAYWDMMKSMVKDDGFAATSQFLTNRRGSKRLVRSKGDIAAGIAYPAFVDSFTAEVLMRARVRQNMSKRRGSMSFEKAMAEADTFVAGMMGDRSKGAMPTIFGATNPLVKALTSFQLENSNQFGFVFKDLKNDSAKAEYVTKLIALALAHALYNDLFEELTGRRPALDPLDFLNDLAGDLTGWKFESIFEIFNGDGDIIKEADKKKVTTATFDALGSAVEQVPFVGGLFGGGRVPIASALPDWEALRKAFEGMEEGASGKYVVQNFYKGIKPTLYNMLPPGGGNQIKKTVEGIDALAKGGSYAYNAKGERTLQYPVGEGEAAKAAVFGKSATKGGREWIENDFDSLSVKQTEAYRRLVASGVSEGDAYAAVTASSESVYAAAISGDTDLLKNIRATYKDEASYNTALRTALRENDPRIMEAIVANINGDIRTRRDAENAIIGEGNFSGDIVRTTVTNATTTFNSNVRDAAEAKRIGDMGKHDQIVNKLVSEQGYPAELVEREIDAKVTQISSDSGADGEAPVTVSSAYSSSDIGAAFSYGDADLALEAVNDLIGAKVSSGATQREAQSTVRSSVTKQLKPLYLAALEAGDKEEQLRIRKFLISTKLYGNSESVKEILSDWAKNK